MHVYALGNHSGVILEAHLNIFFKRADTQQICKSSDRAGCP
jgi:hypothetical protein